VSDHALHKEKSKVEVVPESTDIVVNPRFFRMAATDPDLLTLRGLRPTVDHLRRNNLGTASYESASGRVISPLFAVIV